MRSIRACRRHGSVLSARAAETGECVASDVMASRDRDLADRRGHVVDCDVDEPFGDFLEGLRPVELVRDLLKTRARCFAIERLVAAGSEHCRELRRVDPPKEQVTVCYRQRAAVAVARGPGFAPALSGPTRKRIPSNRQIDPPPAATVWICIIGARIRTPATTLSSASSNSPHNAKHRSKSRPCRSR